MTNIKTHLYYNTNIVASVAFTCACGKYMNLDSHVDLEDEIPDIDGKIVVCDTCKREYKITEINEFNEDEGEHTIYFTAKLNIT